ncbi:MAG: cation transporter dimerization domain-containing protein, partial [Chloroflexota bacterium]
LLIGESAAPEIVEAITELVAEADGIDRMNEIRTLHRGPNDVLLAVSIDFKNNITVGKVENTIYKLELAIKESFPQVRRLYIEVQNKRHHAEEVRKAEEGRTKDLKQTD